MIGAGVVKSGSPIESTITSAPPRLAATAALWISQAAAPSPLIRSTRDENRMMLLLSFCHEATRQEVAYIEHMFKID